MSEVRLTHQGLRVLKLFLDNPDWSLAGVDVMKETGLPSGTLYPILLRFERSGLLRSEWESGKSQLLGRPRRRLYQLTGQGARTARHALGELTRSTRLAGVRGEL